MGKLIGYARVSTRVQDTDRQVRDLLAAEVRRGDLHIEHGVSGAQTSGLAFERALDALHDVDTGTLTHGTRKNSTNLATPLGGRRDLVGLAARA